MLGKVGLYGIQPAQSNYYQEKIRGVPQIEVTFDIDANATLHVVVRDKSSGKMNQTTIKKIWAQSMKKQRRC